MGHWMVVAGIPAVGAQPGLVRMTRGPWCTPHLASGIIAPVYRCSRWWGTRRPTVHRAQAKRMGTVLGEAVGGVAGALGAEDVRRAASACSRS